MSQSGNIIDQFDVGLVLVVHHVVFTISTSVVPQGKHTNAKRGSGPLDTNIEGDRQTT